MIMMVCGRTDEWEENCKKASSKTDKLNAMVEFLTEQIPSEGGYPPTGIWVGKTFVAAHCYDGEPSLTTYTENQLLEWFDDARQLQANHHNWPFSDCLDEAEWTKLRTKVKP